MKIVSFEAKYPSSIVLGRQRLVGVCFFEQIGSAEIELFIREKVPEFREVYKPANACIGRRLRAGVVRSNRHGMFNIRV
jgi:hypothetical protein